MLPVILPEQQASITTSQAKRTHGLCRHESFRVGNLVSFCSVFTRPDWLSVNEGCTADLTTFYDSKSAKSNLRVLATRASLSQTRGGGHIQVLHSRCAPLKRETHCFHYWSTVHTQGSVSFGGQHSDLTILSITQCSSVTKPNYSITDSIAHGVLFFSVAYFITRGLYLFIPLNPLIPLF